ARIMEKGLCERLVQVGIRTLSEHQAAQIEKYGVELIRMFELEKLTSLKMEGPVYISLDLDVFDPAFVPGVSHHEAGGMSPRELINFLLKANLNLIGADIVEYNPFRDQSEITAALASKMLKELVAKMIE
ncbi:MAG: arginase family protein, partial [Bacteroidota bacterium]